MYSKYSFCKIICRNIANQIISTMITNVKNCQKLD